MNLRKNITTIFLILFMAGTAYCQQAKPYRLDGSLPGAKDGLMVYLSDVTDYPYTLLDSTRIKSEKFTFQGKNLLAFPIRVQVVIDKSPNEKDERKKNRNADYFFLDNSAMTLECPIDSMPNIYYEEVSKVHNVIVKGGLTQDLHTQYEASIKELTKQRKSLDAAYMKTYHLPAIKGVFNTREGMGIAAKDMEVKQQIRDLTFGFIKKNPGSVVSVELAQQLLNRSNARMTVAEINNLVGVIDQSLAHAPSFVKLKEIAERELVIAKGVTFMDIKLKDTAGKEV